MLLCWRQFNSPASYIRRILQKKINWIANILSEYYVAANSLAFHLEAASCAPARFCKAPEETPTENYQLVRRALRIGFSQALSFLPVAHKLPRYGCNAPKKSQRDSMLRLPMLSSMLACDSALVLAFTCSSKILKRWKPASSFGRRQA